LATTDGSATVPITAGPVCAGTFAGESDNVVVECSQAAPTFLAPTYYEAAARTTLSYTQLSPPLNDPSPPGAPTVSPDGSTLLYLDSRTDGLGTYRGVFAVALSTPPAADALVSPRLPAVNAEDWIVSFSAGSRQMLQAVFGAGTGAGSSCDLWSVPLATPASLVQVSPASLSSGSCPRTGAYSPDGSKVVFIAPAQTNGLGGTGIYEVMLANPSAVQTLVAPVTGIYYDAVVYDETGSDLFLTSNLSGTNRNDLFEWHRGASSPFSQLNPVGLTSQSFTVTPDGAMIIWLANDPVAAPAWKAYLIDRSVPGQAWRLSSATATLGVSPGVSLILGH
jgi:Tol biopolymer transport system component